MKEWMTARELMPHINAAREKNGYKPYKNSTSILLALRRNHVPCRFQRGHNEFATQKSISIISKNPSDTASKISEKKQEYIKQKLLQAGKKHRHEQCGVRELLPIVNEIRAKKGMVLIVSTSALSNLLTCAKVPRKKIERTLYIYSAREAIKAATKLTKQNDNWCLYATEQELDSGEWATMPQACKELGVSYRRQQDFYKRGSLIRKRHPITQRILVNKKQLEDLAAWRDRRFIIRYKGEEYFDKIKETAAKKTIKVDDMLHRVFYYCPQLIRLGGKTMRQIHIHREKHTLSCTKRKTCKTKPFDHHP